MTTAAKLNTRVIAEKQENGRFKFVVVYPLGTRLLCGGRLHRSVRTWSTKRSAVDAGRREFGL